MTDRYATWEDVIALEVRDETDRRRRRWELEDLKVLEAKPKLARLPDLKIQASEPEPLEPPPPVPDLGSDQDLIGTIFEVVPTSRRRVDHDPQEPVHLVGADPDVPREVTEILGGFRVYAGDAPEEDSSNCWACTYGHGD